MIWAAVLLGSLGCWVEKFLGYLLPATRASRTKDWPVAKVCTATSAASSATGMKAAMRVAHGDLSVVAGRR